MMALQRRGLTYEQAQERLLSVICDNARVRPEELSKDKHLRDDLHLDSLDLLGVLSALEGEFQIAISDDEALRFDTIAAAGDLLWEKLA